MLPAACAALAGMDAQAGEPPDLHFPVVCEIGRNCWFFAYMDLDLQPRLSGLPVRAADL